MQKRSNNKQSNPPRGVKHKGTITLADGQTFSKQQIKKDPAKVMAAIIQQQRTLYSKQIEHWIHARANAENPIYPIRTQLYDIYDDTMIDGFLHGLIYNHRILPVKNKEFKIKNAAGQPDDVKAKLFKNAWFRDFIEWALESKFYGYSLIYMKELVYDGKMSSIKKLELIPRKHVHQERHLWTIYESDLEGTDYTVPPTSNYVIPVGREKDLGLLNKATPLVILKKHGWNNWDEFAERFGMPIMTVKTASQDPRVQSEIEGWLQNLSTGAYGIFPQDTELDIKESKKTDAYQVFMELINKVDEELAVMINGQTMTSMNGSSKSQGEVHERVKDEVTADDEMFVTLLINELLIPLLRDVHKYPFVEGDCFEFYKAEDLQALLKIYTGINNMGFQLDPDEVSEKFNVKILGLKQVTPAKPGNDKPTPDDPEFDEEQQEDAPQKPDKATKRKKGNKVIPEGSDDENLTARDLIKLHGSILKLYGGKNVH